jgi:2-dehydro-3-deoxy-D-arabinonate dehydratase
VTTDELADVTDREIRLIIRRAGAELFADSTSTARMHRTLAELCAYVFRCNEYPFGVFLMTGTGIVPPSEFTLRDGDEVAIVIDGIGTLVNPVMRLEA